jgi:hypothetical protein
VPFLGTAAIAAALLVIGSVGHRMAFAPLATTLGLSVCGGAAAYVLDEEAGDVADATPTSRGRRLTWRLLILVVPASVAVGGLVVLDLLDAPTRWLRLVALVAGCMACGVAIAAALRRAGVSAPGDLASALTASATLVVVAADPLHRWVSVAPLGETAHPGRSFALWGAVVLLGGAVTLSCTRDPARVSRAAVRTST